MGIFEGSTTIAKIQEGSNNIAEVYEGSNLVWSGTKDVRIAVGVGTDVEIYDDSLSSQGTYTAPANSINFLAVDSTPDIFVAPGDTTSQMYKIDASGNEITTRSLAGANKGLGVDSNGNVFYTAYFDIYKLNNAIDSELASDGTRSEYGVLGITSSGDVFTVYDSGANIQKYDNSLNTVTNSVYIGGLKDVAVDSNDNIFTGDDGGLVRKWDTSLNQVASYDAGSTVHKIDFDSNNNVFIGLNSGKVEKLNNALDTSLNSYTQIDFTISALTVDLNGNVYVGTESSYNVWKLDNSLNEVNSISTSNSIYSAEAFGV